MLKVFSIPPLSCLYGRICGMYNSHFLTCVFTMNVFLLQRKVEYIKKTSAILQETYHGDIPNTVADLCKLPGTVKFQGWGGGGGGG